MSAITVVLIDDHELFRAGLKSLLTQSEGIEVIGEAPDPTSGMALIRAKAPDVVLLDISFVSASGIDVCGQLIEERPARKIIMLTMHTGLEYLTPSFEAGASGYVLKEAAVEELTTAIRVVQSGKKYISSDLIDPVLEVLFGRAKAVHRKIATTDEYNSLSSREQELLRMLGQGQSNEAIADHLEISPATVKKHRSNIMGKLAIHKSTDLILFALKHDLTE